MRAPRLERGFTLIEVLVALVIVAIGMAALMSALTSSASTLAYLRDKTFANWVALNQIATVRLTAEQQNQAPSQGDSNGDVDFAGRSWHWQQEITTTDMPGIVRIDVKVRPADIKTTDDNSGWYTTVSGMYGDAVGAPRGDLPTWGRATGVMMPGTQGMEGGMQSTMGSDTSSFFSSSSSSSSSSLSSSSDDLFGSHP